MKRKLLPAFSMGLLALISIQAHAQTQDVKAWVKEDPQAEQANKQLPHHAYAPLALFLGTAGATAHEFIKAGHLKEQARKSTQAGGRITAARLERRAARSEATGGVTALLVVPTAFVAIQSEMDAQKRRAKLVDEKVNQRVEKARAVQFTPAEMLEGVNAPTSSDAAK